MAEECRSCTRYGKNVKYIIPKISAKPLPLLTQPGQELQSDYAGPLEDHKGKQIYLLIAIDRYSKFLSVKVTKSTGGKSTIKFFVPTLTHMGYQNRSKRISFQDLKEKQRKNFAQRIIFLKNSVQLVIIEDVAWSNEQYKLLNEDWV